MSRKRTRHWSPAFPMTRSRARSARLRPTPFPDTARARNCECKRHGTVTADLVTGHRCGGRPAPGVHRLSPSTGRQLPSRNQTSAGQVRTETLAFLVTCRFEFMFTPKHGLNLVESFFSKAARTLLRGVTSKEELVDRAVPTSNPLRSSGPARTRQQERYFGTSKLVTVIRKKHSIKRQLPDNTTVTKPLTRPRNVDTLVDGIASFIWSNTGHLPHRSAVASQLAPKHLPAYPQDSSSDRDSVYSLSSDKGMETSCRE